MLVDSSFTHRSSLFALAALVLLASAGGALAAPACDVTGADASAIASARATVQAACSCAGAASGAAWQRCVRDTLRPLIGSSISAACERHVRRLETRATCGKSQRVVCCRTDMHGATRATLRRAGACPPPKGGAACESASPYLADGCTLSGCAEPPTPCGDGFVDPGETCDPPDGITCDQSCQVCAPDGCTVASACGNGNVDGGEGCDPPNGTTCSRTCTSCAPAAPGEILIGCTSGSGAVATSAVPGALLVACDDVTPGGLSHVLARRLGNDGSVLDATPLAVSELLPNGAGAVGGSTNAATADGTDFYVGWSTYGNYFSYFGGRRVPASGPIASGAETIASNLPIGYCRSYMGGPLSLAPQLAGGSFLATWRVVYACGADVYFETIAGVGDFFGVPPPGNVSSGPAPIVRGASDVAAVWWNGFASSVQPPMVQQFLAASWVQPGTPSMLLLSNGFSTVPPALAAVGDTFVAAWASGNAVRVMRFTRAGGALDPDGGLLLATGGGTIGDVAAASDGAAVLVAWRESAGPGQSAIRAIRIAADGTIPVPTPIEVAASTPAAAVSVAANASAALVAFTREETAGTSIRAVHLGP